MARGRKAVDTLALAAVVLVLAAPAPARAADDEVVIRLDTIHRLDDLSRVLWPDWRVSDTPVLLYDHDGACYMLGHPDPPEAFERHHTRRPHRRSFESAPTASVGAAPESGLIAGAPTAVVTWQRFRDEAVPAVFEEAFRVHVAEACPELAGPVDLIEGYPVTGENLALSDIECELLARALIAPRDSLAARSREFVAVRSFRRVVMGSPVAEEYERALEFGWGLPAYVAERCRTEAQDHLDTKSAAYVSEHMGSPRDFGACLGPADDIEWYRRDRFRWSGAAVCTLLDELRPGWRGEIAGRCREPYDVLWELTRTELPNALDILAERGYAQRVPERAAFIEGTKTEAERRFEDIVHGERASITIDTRLLASSSVSYDPENIEQVDDHRFIHKRVLKIEYSGGTRVHVMGRPAAVFVGEDEFDIARLVVEAPDEYVVTVGGERLVLTPGVHHADDPLSVSGQGLLIEARAGVIMVGESRVTFVLHR